VSRFEINDFRLDWLSQLFAALSGVIDDIHEKLGKVDGYDETFALEESESILGIAFIAAQTYVEGTVADIKAVHGKSKQLKKWDLLALEVKGETFADGVTRLQLVDAIANYHKHHEAWDDWRVNANNEKTIGILNKSRINKETEFPCNRAAALLWPASNLGEFRYLLNILADWRERVFREYGSQGNSSLVEEVR
jgi:hypothetical protein